MIKKMKNSWFYIFNMFFLIIVFFSFSVRAHEGQRMQLFGELEKAQQGFPQDSISLVATVAPKSIATEVEFYSLFSNPVSKPVVMMIGSATIKNIKNLDTICNNVGASFYALDVEKNAWVLSWLAKNLSYSAQSFPLFLFFQGKELLLPLCQGDISEDLFLQVIQKKFKGLRSVQKIALQKNDSLKSRLFPQVDFILTATSIVKMG